MTHLFRGISDSLPFSCVLMLRICYIFYCKSSLCSLFVNKLGYCRFRLKNINSTQFYFKEN